MVRNVGAGHLQVLLKLIITRLLPLDYYSIFITLALSSIIRIFLLLLILEKGSFPEIF